MKSPVLAILLLFLICTSSFAAEIRVPADQPTIQAGLDAAVHGDMVLVADGLYRGQGNRDLNFRGKAITLQSENGPLNCTIDAEGSPGSDHRCIIFDQDEQYDSILRGFTLTGGFHSEIGGGIYISYDTSPFITGNIITGNRSAQGGGIGCVFGDPRIEKNIFHDNGYISSSQGGAVYCHGSGADILNNLFVENIIDGPGGAVYLKYREVRLEGNRFIGNAAEGDGSSGVGGAIAASGVLDSTEIVNNLFQGNDADRGGAIHCSQSDPTISGNVFTDNHAAGGGAVYCEAGALAIDNCRFTGNRASWGAAINFNGQTIAHLTNSLFSDNLAGYSGGAIGASIDSEVVVRGCTFANNKAVIAFGGAVDVFSGAEVSVSDSILWGNEAPEGPQIRVDGSGTIFGISYCAVQGGYPDVLVDPDSHVVWGAGMFAYDPLFTGDALGEYFLSQIAAGQTADSPCIDAGNPLSPTPEGSTRTDLVADGGLANMGFHWSTTWRLAAGPGPGPDNPPDVHLFLPYEMAEPALSFNAYGVPRYGVKLATGNLLGGDRRQIVTGPGPGAVFGPHVRAFEADGDPISKISFLAYGTNKFGVNVACGNLSGVSSGTDEIVTGAGPGAVFGPHVRGWSVDSGALAPMPGVSFFAYGTNKWGVNVACGDIDGDSCDEIITGAGPGAVFGPHVRGWNVDGLAARAMPGVNFLAYGTNKWGVRVAAGDIDGDGIDELLTAPGPSSFFAAHIRGWKYDGETVQPIPGVNFFAWEMAHAAYGATLCVSPDLDRDGRDEIVVGAGPDPDGASMVDIFRYDDSSCTRWFGVTPFPELTHGATAAAGWMERP